MLKQILIILFTYSSLSFSESSLKIKGYFKGFSNDSCAMILKYDFENTIIAKVKLDKGICFFENIELEQDGIYQIMVVDQDTHESKSYAFDIIVDKSENVVSFEFEPKKNSYPKIVESNINKNWYEFLEIEKFRLSVIDFLKSNIQKKQRFSENGIVSNEKMLENEIAELINLKEKYILKNNNRWSTAAVKNNPIYFDLIQNKKEMYWKHFESNNPDLINTNIYPILIRYYVTKYYNSSIEEQYKKCFDELIKVFSNNIVTKKWILTYISIFIKQLNNKELLNYYNSKYSN